MSLYEETIALIPYTDILSWELEQIATNPDMAALLEKLSVREEEEEWKIISGNSNSRRVFAL